MERRLINIAEPPLPRAPGGRGGMKKEEGKTCREAGVSAVVP